MKDWEKFEIQATEFLNNFFSRYNYTFKRRGKKSSVTPDIKVFQDEKHLFNIEAKFSPAQSGQFVVHKEDKQFIFSDKNVCNNNKHTKRIIKHLNENFSNFKDGGNLPEDLEKTYAKRIINHYLSKNSMYIITSNKLDGFYSIFPTEKINENFKITAKLRKKRSGTRHLPYKDFQPVKHYLENHFKRLDTRMNDYFFMDEKKRAIVKTNKPISNHDDLYFGNKKYYLSEIETENENKYYVKKRSNVNNLNVIFSLEYIGPEENNGFEKFENYLVNY